MTKISCVPASWTLQQIRRSTFLKQNSKFEGWKKLCGAQSRNLLFRFKNRKHNKTLQHHWNLMVSLSSQHQKCVQDKVQITLFYPIYTFQHSYPSFRSYPFETTLSNLPFQIYLSTTFQHYLLTISPTFLRPPVNLLPRRVHHIPKNNRRIENFH